MAARGSQQKKVGSVAVHPVAVPQAAAAEPALAGVQPLPVSVPKPPAAYVVKKGGKGKRKGHRPQPGQTSVVAAVAAEIGQNAQAYLAEFGAKAPAATHVASVLGLAAGWNGVAHDTATFDAYAREQRGLAWDAALALVRVLQPGLTFAVARDASVGERFPALVKLVAMFRRGPRPSATPRKPRTKKGATAATAHVAATQPTTAQPTATEPATATHPAGTQPTGTTTVTVTPS